MNARTRKFFFLLTFVFIFVFAFCVWKFLHPPEPVYNGKPLSAWAEQWGSNHWVTHSGAEAKKADQEAQAAIQHIGTNGIPFLLDLMRARESALKTKLRTKLPRRWLARLHLEDRASRLKHAGAHGLAALGTNAGPAVPGLMELVSIEMTRNPPDRNDGYLPVWTLGYLRGAAEPAVPLMIECLTNRDQSIRLDAAHGLGMINRRPDVAVPALVAYIEFQKQANGSGERSAAIQSLGQFGTNASAATPAFVALLRDSDPSIRQAATNWLPYINRTAAERAKLRIPWER